MVYKTLSRNVILIIEYEDMLLLPAGTLLPPTPVLPTMTAGAGIVPPSVHFLPLDPLVICHLEVDSTAGLIATQYS